MQDSIKHTLLDTFDEETKKRYRLYRIQKQDGLVIYQLFIVDPYMTLTFDISEADLLNLKSALNILNLEL